VGRTSHSGGTSSTWTRFGCHSPNLVHLERTLESKYRLERLLGKGGMGAVYEASDLRLGRRVAIKVMTGRLFGDKEALRRFEREARASARLNHPNIIIVHDYGRAGAEGAYLVMELVAGATLRDALNSLGPLLPTDAATHFEHFAGLPCAFDIWHDVGECCQTKRKITISDKGVPPCNDSSRSSYLSPPSRSLSTCGRRNTHTIRSNSAILSSRSESTA